MKNEIETKSAPNGGIIFANAGGMARELAAQDSESTTDLNG